MRRGEIAIQDQEKGGNPLHLSLDDMAIPSAKEHQTRRRRSSLKHLDHPRRTALLLLVSAAVSDMMRLCKRIWRRHTPIGAAAVGRHSILHVPSGERGVHSLLVLDSLPARGSLDRSC